jgi:hypothetical protein
MGINIHSEELLESKSVSIQNIVLPLIYFLLFVFSFLCSSNLLFSDYKVQFWVLTGIIATHNISELLLVYRNESRRFWIQPIVLGCVVIFLLQLGGVTNFLYRNSDGFFYINYNNVFEREPQWLVKTMSLVLLASLTYWMGYKLHYGRNMANLYLRYYGKILNFSVSHYTLLGGLLFGWTIKLILNYYGGLGHRFGELTKSLGHMPGFVYRLKIFEDVSLVFTLIFMFLAYRFRSNVFYRNLFLISLSMEILFAFTSGARSTIVFVFIGVFFVDYFFKERFRLIWIIAGTAILYFAMTTLNQFKSFALNPANHSIEIKDPVEYIRLASQYSNLQSQNIKDEEKVNQAIYLGAIGRFNYINEAAHVVRYKDTNGLTSKDPDFIAPLFTFPIFAVLPKFYLFGEESDNFGTWATELIVGHHRYSTAISPLGYAYAAGGTAGVAIIFLILGILMKFAGVLLAKVKSVIAFVVFLAILEHLVMFDSVVSGTFLNLVRFGLLLPPILWLVFKK